MKYRLLVIFSTIIFGLTLTSFGLNLSYHEPKIHFDKYEVKKVTFQDSQVNFLYTVTNDNSIGINHIC